jgi:hypothetical protein
MAGRKFPPPWFEVCLAGWQHNNEPALSRVYSSMALTAYQIQ